MRERLDFSAISKIILDNRKIGAMSQVEYYFCLFQYAFNQANIKLTMPEDSEVSKIISGQRNVAKDIIYLYQSSFGITELKTALEGIFEDLSDAAYVKEQIYRILWDDGSISQAKKQELSANYADAASFISECLLFALSRNFLPKSKKEAGAKLILSDYLLDTRLPSVTRNFIGRENELKEIDTLLQHERCIFLEGIGGIGKSELAKYYANHYKKQYSNVIYLRYNESLRRTILEMDFLDDTVEMTEEARFRNHYRFFKYLDSRTLVILDNFDSVPEDEEMFHTFLSMHFQILATTRSHIADAVCYKVNEIENIEDLKQLFFAYAPSAKQQPEITADIIEEVYRHTLTVELAAKTLTASGMEASDFLQALRTEGLSLSNPNKVILTKDNVSHKQRLYQHIQTLFQIQGLSPDALDTLRNMVLMPSKGISKVLFHTWQGKLDWNTTNDLVEYGWIQEDTVHNQISLHPYLHELLKTETVPAITSCANLLKGVFENCIVYGMDVPYYNALLNTIESIYHNIKLDNAESAAMFMDTTLAYLAKYGRIDAVAMVLNLMKNMPDYGENKRHTAVFDCYMGYVEYMNGRYQKAKQHYLHGLELLEPFHPVNADLVSNLKNNLGQTYLALGERQTALSVTEEAILIRQKYGTVSSHDTLVQGLSYAQLLAANGNWQEARKRLFALIRFVKKIKGMNLFLAQLYKSLAVIEAKKLPEDSLQHYRKAKQALLDGFLPGSHPEIQKINQAIQREKVLVRTSNEKKMHII
ncbi:hypothetical protein [Mediterraneibacter agrestimuris]|uniref:hypothetical protein n=1 Tax=Mediterraneibacter agrestimuris TaxID=2941333 RepID=UPI0020412574|nr:hypothetical protein [Mediterraneibacter agrestimuris]